MNKILRTAAAMMMAGTAASASAWWGGPFSSWGDDFFGGGGFSFSFTAHGSGHGWGRYHDHYGPFGCGPYAAYAPYGVGPSWGGYAPYAPVYPYAPVHAVLYSLTAEQQRAATEQQTRMGQQTVAARRQFAGQIAQQQTRVAVRQPAGFDPLSMDPFAGFDPYSRDPMATASRDAALPEEIKRLIEESDAAYAKAKADNQARRETFEKRAAERRAALQERARGMAPWLGRVDQTRI
jgi:hypothetical protein